LHQFESIPLSSCNFFLLLLNFFVLVFELFFPVYFFTLRSSSFSVSDFINVGEVGALLPGSVRFPVTEEILSLPAPVNTFRDELE